MICFRKKVKKVKKVQKAQSALTVPGTFSECYDGTFQRVLPLWPEGIVKVLAERVEAAQTQTKTPSKVKH